MPNRNNKPRRNTRNTPAKQTRHTLVARNWNGLAINMWFNSKATTFDGHVSRAHRALRLAGYNTYQLLEVDGNNVQLLYQYA